MSSGSGASTSGDVDIATSDGASSGDLALATGNAGLADSGSIEIGSGASNEVGHVRIQAGDSAVGSALARLAPRRRVAGRAAAERAKFRPKICREAGGGP